MLETNRNTSILLVEDDEIDILNVRRTFKKNQITYPLNLAKNGLEALTILKGEGDIPPTEMGQPIVFLDLNMPKMDGFEFLQALRNDSKCKSLEVIVLTNSDHPQDRARAKELDVAGYIVKPLTYQKLIEAVSIPESLSVS